MAAVRNPFVSSLVVSLGDPNFLQLWVPPVTKKPCQLRWLWVTLSPLVPQPAQVFPMVGALIPHKIGWLMACSPSKLVMAMPLVLCPYHPCWLTDYLKKQLHQASVDPRINISNGHWQKVAGI